LALCLEPLPQWTGDAIGAGRNYSINFNGLTGWIETLDTGTESELCSSFVLLGRSTMIRSLIEEAAALASLTLFIGMVVIWAQVISTL
jgi:hypothetical protein